MRSTLPRTRDRRRGVTLVEMLVAVALLVLMMTVIVTVFAAATGAVSTAKAYQEIDARLRQIDSVLRTDLQGLTARMTPPLDPDQNLGYFEYGENQFADLQGEDADDYVRFTTKAPEGQLFTGRAYLNPTGAAWTNSVLLSTQPVTISSQFAEIIYFLRNGNLYRRVFLVVPERQGTLTLGPNTGGGYTLNGGQAVSWQGMNDVSARPNPVVPASGSAAPILNTLGDLTNRENRAFAPRFCNSYTNSATGTADDTNADSVPDYYSTIYPGVFGARQANNTTNPFLFNLGNVNSANLPAWAGGTGTDAFAFPFIYPGAYSVADTLSSSTLTGNIHGLFPNGQAIGSTTPSPSIIPYGFIYTYPNYPVSGGVYQATLGLAQYNPAFGVNPVTIRPNHGPLDVGDSLTVPSTAAQTQTWWGFPTWRETMSASWLDPVWQLNANSGAQATGLSSATLTLLPPMTTANDLQLFNDGAGSATFLMPSTVFRDDLLMTGVRSFDVKAYDPTALAYVDLGYSDLTTGFDTTLGFSAFPDTTNNVLSFAQSVYQGFGHEGRIPPLFEDYRVDVNSPLAYPNNVLGDETASLTRLRRVFDTWSTEYTQAPQQGIASGLLVGPSLGGVPYYPSFPAPYPAGLRGIQIQIRVVDPQNQRIKSLTIRQDFSDKL
jgi:prepilin-type N-terminal cleavage/methylation domain-containing protein